MATIQMNIKRRFFDYIKSGTKRIELRLYDEKRAKIQLGDVINFNSGDEHLSAEVVGLLRYQKFVDLFQDFNISMLSDASMTKEELLNVLEEFYPPEKQAQFGVVGIRIRPLNQD